MDTVTAMTVLAELGDVTRFELPVEALDPAAAVLPDDEAELLLRAACIEAIDAAAEADDERTAALRGIGVYHAGLRLPRMVAERDAVEAAFAAMGADSTGWPARVRAILDAHYGPQQTSIREQVQAIAARIRRDADAVSERLAEIVRDVMAPLSEACEADSWQEFAACLGGAAARIRLNAGRRSPPDSDVKDALRELRDELAAEAASQAARLKRARRAGPRSSPPLCRRCWCRRRPPSRVRPRLGNLGPCSTFAVAHLSP